MFRNSACFFSDFLAQKRSLSDENLSSRSSPEPPFTDKAWCLSPDLAAADQSDVHNLLVTPQVIGKVMSRDDPFYTPAKNNPFVSQSKFKDGRKLVETTREMLSPFDLPSPSVPQTPPCTPLTPDEWACWSRRQSFVRQRSHSLPSSPTLLRRVTERLYQDLLQARGSVSGTSPRNRGLSEASVIKKFDFEDGDLEYRDSAEKDDDSSSNDSAVDFTLKSCQSRLPRKHLNMRKRSVDHCFFSDRHVYSPFGVRSRHPDEWVLSLRRHPIDDKEETARSCSSSESCMSLDDSSILSPTSSMSSYSEAELEILYGRTHLELQEHRARYAEIRPDVKELVRKWEMKQIEESRKATNHKRRPKSCVGAPKSTE